MWDFHLAQASLLQSFPSQLRIQVLTFLLYQFPRPASGQGLFHRPLWDTNVTAQKDLLKSPCPFPGLKKKFPSHKHFEEQWPLFLYIHITGFGSAHQTVQLSDIIKNNHALHKTIFSHLPLPQSFKSKGRSTPIEYGRGILYFTFVDFQVKLRF